MADFWLCTIHHDLVSFEPGYGLFSEADNTDAHLQHQGDGPQKRFLRGNECTSSCTAFG